MWKLNNTHLNNPRSNEDVPKSIKKHVELDENKNTTYQYMWDAAEMLLEGN